MPKSITSMMPALGSLLKRVIANFAIVAMVVAAACVLLRLDLGANAPTPEGAAGSGEPGGSGVIIRSEVVRLSLPETLIDLRQRELNASVALTDHELKIALERRRQGSLWYAVTIRGHQVNGDAIVMTFVRHPHREPEHFQELLDVLAAVAANRDPDLAAGDNGPMVHIVQANMSEQQFIEAVRERRVR